MCSVPLHKLTKKGFFATIKHMDKKELILSEAEKLFAEKGYYGLGLSELLNRCGIPKGSFYYYFPDGKIQLIQEVLEYSYQRMRTRIAEWMMDEPTALSAFSRMADRLSRGVVEKRMLASMLLSMIAIESVYLDPQVNETCQRLYADWQQYYAACLNHFGVPAEACQPKAQAVFALIHGSLISSWTKHNPEDLQLAKLALKDILTR